MAQVKELHVCKSKVDLEKRTEIPDVRTKKMQILLETARKLYKEAEKYYCDGDEELAYIYYMKYFSLLTCIHKKPDYLQHKQVVRDMLGGKTSQTDTMDKLELLSKSLDKRYRRLSEVKLSITKGDKLVGNGDMLAAEAYNNIYNEHKVITCAELFRLMQEKSVLIMDCRPSSDYDSSHLSYPSAFNVPEELITAGMSAGKLQDKLNNNAKVLWSARSIKKQVVLMDWKTKDPNPPENIPIAILLDILQNWDPDVNYQSPIKILEHGYEYFILMYPTLCTNPTVQSPQRVDVDDGLLDDIEYPSINDITMKDEVQSSLENSLNSNGSATNVASAHMSVQRPSVDRSSKLAAIKTYNDNQKPVVEIIKEQNELLEKARDNDEQLKRASMKWESLVEKLKNENREEPTSTEQELLYNIMQLDSVAKDYKAENNRLRDELFKYKTLEKQQRVNEATESRNDLEEIETKIQERQKIDEQNEMQRLQRENQLAKARENKRHLKPPIMEEGDISQPKIPQFDRSIKPQLAAATGTAPLPQLIIERQRDFSPVPGAMGRGLTGLKNLGNTCYMNSILQCLSNTQPLTEYCLTDKYKNYISRNNKTKGQVVEEVAALIKILWNGNNKCVASKDLRYVVGQYQQIFCGIEQQDSHEFLTILMDWLHSDLQTLPVPKKLRDNVSASERAWMEFTKSKESLILHLFYGQIKSTVKCVDCNKESATYESFSNLSLELPVNATHLTQCMDIYFSGEKIYGWNCPDCKKKRNAVKKLDISKLPSVLVIHFKRFYAYNDVHGNSYRKKQDYMGFPLEDLDMSPYIAKSELRSLSPKTYQLYGVSNHYGSMESGHYTAFCKNGNNGRWFKFDDQSVTPMDKSNVVSSAAYILFYTRLPPIQLPESN